MKSVFITGVFLMTNIGVAFAAAPSETCPSGYVTKSNAAINLFAGDCPSGTVAVGTTNTCLASNHGGVCSMYVPANTSYSDSGGTYLYEDTICPMTQTVAAGTGTGEAKRCLRTSNTTECVYANASANAVDWVAHCDDAWFVGVSECSNYTWASLLGEVGFPTDSAQAKNCYCTIIWPAESSYWVLAGNYSSTSQCMSSCAAACANKMKTDATFRDNLYKSWKS